MDTTISTPIPEQDNEVLYTPAVPVENTTIFTPAPEPATTGCGVTMSCSIDNSNLRIMGKNEFGVLPSSDAEAFKKEYGYTDTSKYDLYVDKSSGTVVITAKGNPRDGYVQETHVNVRDRNSDSNDTE